VILLIGHFLNNWLNSDYLGFVILLGFTLVVFALSFIYRKKFLEAMRNMMMKKDN